MQVGDRCRIGEAHEMLAGRLCTVVECIDFMAEVVVDDYKAGLTTFVSLKDLKLLPASRAIEIGSSGG
jgi:hypothetical protein